MGRITRASGMLPLATGLLPTPDHDTRAAPAREAAAATGRDLGRCGVAFGVLADSVRGWSPRSWAGCDGRWRARGILAAARPLEEAVTFAASPSSPKGRVENPTNLRVGSPSFSIILSRYAR